MKSKFLFTTILLLSAAIPVFAEEKQPPDARNVELGYLRNRPKDTTSEEVNAMCYYLAGNLHIEFTTPEGQAKATITRMDSGDTVSHTFLTFSPATISIGTTPGLYEILLTTSHGGKYLGHLTIN
ncbi:hypothetical protein [uncultured Muribaculum sp.]|uniref:hypothetical protein n=1 Tax=uncultured Muribaculum sp. TaxID=1918613 RepID=UPI0025F684DD|nr:hypothetical protein [uncultured Muribaculum sp.]